MNKKMMMWGGVIAILLAAITHLYGMKRPISSAERMRIQMEKITQDLKTASGTPNDTAKVLTEKGIDKILRQFKHSVPPHLQTALADLEDEIVTAAGELAADLKSATPAIVDPNLKSVIENTVAALKDSVPAGSKIEADASITDLEKASTLAPTTMKKNALHAAIIAEIGALGAAGAGTAEAIINEAEALRAAQEGAQNAFNALINPKVFFNTGDGNWVTFSGDPDYGKIQTLADLGAAAKISPLQTRLGTLRGDITGWNVDTTDANPTEMGKLADAKKLKVDARVALDFYKAQAPAGNPTLGWNDAADWSSFMTYANAFPKSLYSKEDYYNAVMAELGDSTKAGSAQYLLDQADTLRGVLEAAQNHVVAHSAPSTPLFDATEPNYGVFIGSDDFATVKTAADLDIALKIQPIQDDINEMKNTAGPTYGAALHAIKTDKNVGAGDPTIEGYLTTAQGYKARAQAELDRLTAIVCKGDSSGSSLWGASWTDFKDYATKFPLAMTDAEKLDAGKKFFAEFLGRDDALANDDITGDKKYTVHVDPAALPADTTLWLACSDLKTDITNRLTAKEGSKLTGGSLAAEFARLERLCTPSNYKHGGEQLDAFMGANYENALGTGAHDVDHYVADAPGHHENFYQMARLFDTDFADATNGFKTMFAKYPLSAKGANHSAQFQGFIEALQKDAGPLPAEAEKKAREVLADFLGMSDDLTAATDARKIEYKALATDPAVVTPKQSWKEAFEYLKANIDTRLAAAALTELPDGNLKAAYDAIVNLLDPAKFDGHTHESLQTFVTDNTFNVVGIDTALMDGTTAKKPEKQGSFYKAAEAFRLAFRGDSTKPGETDGFVKLYLDRGKADDQANFEDLLHAMQTNAGDSPAEMAAKGHKVVTDFTTRAETIGGTGGTNLLTGLTAIYKDLLIRKDLSGDASADALLAALKDVVEPGSINDATSGKTLEDFVGVNFATVPVFGGDDDRKAFKRLADAFKAKVDALQPLLSGAGGDFNDIDGKIAPLKNSLGKTPEEYRTMVTDLITYLKTKTADYHDGTTPHPAQVIFDSLKDLHTKAVGVLGDATKKANINANTLGKLILEIFSADGIKSTSDKPGVSATKATLRDFVGTNFDQDLTDATMVGGATIECNVVDKPTMTVFKEIADKFEAAVNGLMDEVSSVAKSKSCDRFEAKATELLTIINAVKVPTSAADVEITAAAATALNGVAKVGSSNLVVANFTTLVGKQFNCFSGLLKNEVKNVIVQVTYDAIKAKPTRAAIVNNIRNDKSGVWLRARIRPIINTLTSVAAIQQEIEDNIANFIADKFIADDTF